MMQCSFPAINDSILHINSFKLPYVHYVGFVLLSFCCELPGAKLWCKKWGYQFRRRPLGPEATEEENVEQVSPPHSTLGSERAS